jgi:hypothetical protein
MSMNWIIVTDDMKPPQDGTHVLLEDINGFIGVGYWNAYDWVLYTYHDVDFEICFDKIKRYLVLD